jgi:rSAM/selenodomain-associated transferase 2
MQVSIIIPTFNESSAIGETLDAVKKLKGNFEIIVVDGVSNDNTVEIVRKENVRVVVAEKGKGKQLHAGASEAKGDVFWFLHADTMPPNDAIEQIEKALSRDDIVGGNFEIKFDGERFAAKFLTWLYPRLRLLGLCYGDSAFFARRDVYLKCGGFPPLPLFEDVELMKRLKQHGNFVHLESVIVSSSRRFEKKSFVLAFARWSLFQVLYWLGVSPHWLAKRYAPIRNQKELETN